MIKSKRQLPNPKYFFSLIDWKLPSLNRSKSLMAKTFTVADIAKVAKKKVPKVVFDYVEGAALEEDGIARSRATFARAEFYPQILRDVSNIDTTTKILGKKVDLPIIFAPTGYTRLMHHTGEPAVAQVAADRNMVYCLSTMGTTSPIELAKAVPDSRRWFQLYLMKNRVDSLNIINQARENGFETLVVTADTPVLGIRIRDARNGMTVPPRIRLSTVLAIAMKPRWWANLLTTPPLEFAAFRGWSQTLSELAPLIFDSSLSYKDIQWLQTVWEGPIVVKGVQCKEDAVKLAKIGVQGIVLSNHGGRQLNRGTVPLEILPEVVAAVGKKMDVYIDGGVMSGQDVYAAIAMGATAVMIGRAYLYGVMADGQRGVEKVIDILKTELINSMGLTGTRTVAEIKEAGIRIRPIG